ncbi:MAG: SEC-C metal-binding domain-containing protein, partial [Candidatus Xenobia bacterium]
RWFDAGLHNSDFGERHLWFRLPETWYEATLQHYCSDDCLSIRQTGPFWLLAFTPMDGGWLNDSQDTFEVKLSDVLPVRSELLAGDHRSLYLAWLRAAELRVGQDDILEPLVPPGLQSLSDAQQHLVRLLQIDRDLLDAAAEGSAPMSGEPKVTELEQRLAGQDTLALLCKKAVDSESRPSPHRVRRNAACPCGSGRKYKKCCVTAG